MKVPIPMSSRKVRSKTWKQNLRDTVSGFFFGLRCARCNNSGSHGVMLK